MATPKMCSIFRVTQKKPGFLHVQSWERTCYCKGLPANIDLHYYQALFDTDTKKVIMSFRRWCFTVNNYTDEQIAALDACECRYLVYGREVAPETGTPHLQGFVCFAATVRLAAVRAIVQCHWEPTRGTSAQAATYCKKDGNYTERGVCPGVVGRTNVLDAAVAWCDVFIVENLRAPTDREVAQEFPIVLVKFRHFMDVIRLRTPIPIIRQGIPQPWQNALAQELGGEPDDRSVIFYVDEQGGSGKTWFQQWHYSNFPDTTQILGVGKVVDVAFTIDPDRNVFLINVPRGGMQFFQYSIVEQLKDRMVFSTKYMSSMKVMRTNVHVVVFCNEFPDYEKLSADRVVVRADYHN